MTSTGISRAANTPSHSLPPLSTAQDITQSAVFQGIVKRHEDILLHSGDSINDFAQLDISPNGKRIAGVTTRCRELHGSLATRLAIVETDTASISTLDTPEGSDTHPKWSGDGRSISFLSHVGGRNQLFLLNLDTRESRQCTHLEGTIERQSWSQDGSSILLLVAGLGADQPGRDGAAPLATQSGSGVGQKAAWMPSITLAAPPDSYRNLWVYNIVSGRCEQVSPAGLNVWEGVWASSNAVMAICSELPGEEDWYRPSLRLIDLQKKSSRTLWTSDLPMEWMAASPSGARIVFAHGIASDRGILKGDLHFLEVGNGHVKVLDTKGVSLGGPVTFCGQDEIVATGSREDEELVIKYNLSTGELSEIWKSRDQSTGDHYMPEVAARLVDGLVHCAFVRQGWFDAPVVMSLAGSSLREVQSLGSSKVHTQVRRLGTARNFTWPAPDGLPIHGYVLEPSTVGPGPYPTVLFVHGGPVWQYRPRYIGGHGQMMLLRLLLENGIAIFKPNVRGSSGRGQKYAAHVYGDMGGKDTNDYLSGLDALVNSNTADPKRLGVYGGSYGGYMSSWLITQTTRFAAAVPVAPISDFVSARFCSHIGHFYDDFLGDDPHDPNGKYFSRSPLHHVHCVQTPTLTIVGALDRSTPPTQGLEFHQALIAQGTPSALLTYPQEGHGIRQMPAFFDMATRMTEWFKHFLLL